MITVNTSKPPKTLIARPFCLLASRHTAKLEEELRAARLEIDHLRSELNALQVGLYTRIFIKFVW